VSCSAAKKKRSGVVEFSQVRALSGKKKKAAVSSEEAKKEYTKRKKKEWNSGRA